MRALLLAPLLALLLFFLPPLSAADTLYASDVLGVILAFDTTSHATTVLSETHVAWYDIALSPAGTLYASDATTLYRIDLQTGAATKVGAFGVFVNGLAFDGATLYASGAESLYTIDLLTGSAHVVGTTGFVSSGDLAVAGGSLYMTALGTDTDLLVRLDRLSGSGAALGPIGFFAVMGLAQASSGLYGFTGNGDVVLIDPATGAGSWTGSVGYRVIYGATGRGDAASGVPEPGALLLVGSGLLVLAKRARCL